MELRQIRYFLALAEQLQFTRAARQAHVAQSTLSHQIKGLEEQLGAALFHRDGKRVLLTPAGEAILPSFRRALAEVEDGVRLLRACRADLEDEVIVAVTAQVFNVAFVPRCISAFIKAHPLVKVRVEHLSVAAAPDQIRQGAVDFGIGDQPMSMEGLHFEPLFDEELALFVDPGHPLAGRKRLQMVELHRQNIVVLTRDRNIRGVLDRYFEEAGSQPNLVAEVSSVAAVGQLVRSSQVGAILARSSQEQFSDLTVVRLQRPTPKRTIGFIWREGEEPRLSIRAMGSVIRRTVQAATATPHSWPYIEPRVRQKAMAA